MGKKEYCRWVRHSGLGSALPCIPLMGASNRTRNTDWVRDMWIGQVRRAPTWQPSKVSQHLASQSLRTTLASHRGESLGLLARAVQTSLSPGLSHR